MREGGRERRGREGGGERRRGREKEGEREGGGGARRRGREKNQDGQICRWIRQTERQREGENFGNGKPYCQLTVEEPYLRLMLAGKSGL